MNAIFQIPSRIVYGAGTIKDLGAEVRRLGANRALIVTDKGLVEHNVHIPVQEALTVAKIPYKLFPGVELDPSPGSITNGALALREFEADVIIGLGGGSALDSAKAVSLLSAHGEPIERFFGIELVPSPCIPTIMIPTTAGTGSEITSIVVLSSAATQSKKGIVSTHLFAKSVVLDPELTFDLPPYYTAITGVDAFVHALESYVNLAATPLTEGVCLQAMRLIADNIRKAYANGRCLEARSAMLYASALSGMGFANTQTGLIHALAHAIPTDHHLPHGLLVAAASPMGIAYNSLAAPEKFANIATILGCDIREKALHEQAAIALNGMQRLLEDLDITQGFAAYGVNRDEIPNIAQRAAGDARLMARNPRQATASSLEKLLNQFF